MSTEDEATMSSDIYGEGIEHPDIQSVLFKRPLWTISQAKRWLTRHGFKRFDVDAKPDHYRFRQIEPEEQFDYITKEVDNGVKYIIIIKRHKGTGINNKYTMPRRRQYESESSDSDSISSGSDSEGEIIRDMKNLTHKIHKHHKMRGGKINIVKTFKKLGSTIKKGFTDEFAKPAEKYITSKKGGLASDLLHEGVPIVTGALAGLAGDALGGPLAGIALGEAGSRLGSYGADQLGKKIGVGLVRGDMVHIDIGSHNAKGKKATSAMKGDGMHEKMARLRAMRKPKGMGLIGDTKKLIKGYKDFKTTVDKLDEKQKAKGQGIGKYKGACRSTALEQLVSANREREAREFLKNAKKIQKDIMEERDLMENPKRYSHQFPKALIYGP